MTDSTLNRFLASGTTTQRLAFTPSPPTPASGPACGELWWDTTLQELFAWNQGTTAWVGIGVGGASAFLDTIGNTQGDILYRGASAWAVLAPGTSGQVLSTGGAGANPSWIPAAGGGVNDMGIVGFDTQTANNMPTGFYLGRMIVSEQTATFNSMKIFSTAAAATAQVYPAVYSVNTNGTLNTLIASGGLTTGVVQGVNKFDFTSGIALTRGVLYAIGLVVQVAGIPAATMGAFSPYPNCLFFTTAGAPPSTPGSTTYGVTQGYHTYWISADT